MKKTKYLVDFLKIALLTLIFYTAGALLLHPFGQYLSDKVQFLYGLF